MGVVKATMRAIGVASAAMALLAVASLPAASQVPAGGARKPNIVFILADDYAMNLVQFMPNLQAMQKDGVTFANYFITNSLCCPSRASILTGKLPHNTKVLTNTRPDGGFAGFNANGNAETTIAVALQRAGYKTAMMGKYLNGYEPKVNPPPPGWSEWAVGGNGYPGFSYDLNQNGKAVRYGATPADYMTDVLSGLGQAFITKSAGTPFFLEIATFAPHAPYTPAPRDANAFPGLVAPRGAAFNVRDPAAPKWLRDAPALGANDLRQIDRAYRLRAQSVLAIDKMIGDIRALLAASGEDRNTYVVFSSDNGYHMGEYGLRPGKMTAYDTDIHVPLVVVGPGVAKGATADGFAMNIDLAPTFAEIGGAALAADGRSLLPLLAGKAVADWRQAAIVEHFRPARFDDDPDIPEGVNPPSYAALRTAGALYVEHADGDIAYYDLAKDPDQLHNIAAGIPAAEKARLHNQLYANLHCQGAAACWEAQRLRASAAAPPGPAVPAGVARPAARAGAPGRRPARPPAAALGAAQRGRRAASWHSLRSREATPMFTRRRLIAGLAATAAARVPRAFAQAAERDREVFYTSDGLRIQAYVSRPPGRGPFPLVIFNHGSRAGQERRSVPFTYMANLYAGAGYAVLVPERRGYGQSEGATFAEAVGADLAQRFIARMEEEAGDVAAAADFAGTLPFVDRSRTALAGWSFGGIVSLLAAARANAFSAVIDQAGGALSWRRSPALQAALLAAAKAIKAPVQLMAAANDATTDAVTTLAQARTAARLPTDLKLYPAFTPRANPDNTAPGHLIFTAEGAGIWAKDATAFLAKNL